MVEAARSGASRMRQRRRPAVAWFVSAAGPSSSHCAVVGRSPDRRLVAVAAGDLDRPRSRLRHSVLVTFFWICSRSGADGAIALRATIPSTIVLAVTGASLPPRCSSASRPSSPLRKSGRHVCRRAGRTPSTGIAYLGVSAPPYRLFRQRRAATTSAHSNSFASMGVTWPL